MDYVYSLGDDLSKIKYVYAIALPSEIVMFKLIRASVGV